jgi:hypothetical protein
MNQRLNILRQLLAAIIVIAVIGGLSSCEKYSWTPEKIDPVIPVLFQTEIQPIFNAKCVSCHTSIRNPDLRDGKSYESLTSGEFVNLPGESSILYLHMTTNPQHIPRSSDQQKGLVLNWINQGALDN